jgi:hypothetical protein
VPGNPFCLERQAGAAAFNSTRFLSGRRFMSTDYRSFLALGYDELEELNLKAKMDG